MPKSHPPYPPGFRRRMLELIRAGRNLESLSREFRVSAQAIRSWIRQADLDAGCRSEGLTTIEREEREILRKAAAWFAKETTSGPKRGSRS